MGGNVFQEKIKLSNSIGNGCQLVQNGSKWRNLTPSNRKKWLVLQAYYEAIDL